MNRALPSALIVLALGTPSAMSRAEAPAVAPLAVAPVAAAPVAVAPVDDDPPPRLSLPTESDRQIWKTPGLRFGLGLVYGRLWGIGGPPDGHLFGPTIRLGLRLDDAWSVMGSLQYLYAMHSGGMRGIRFAGTIAPTWHVSEHFALAAGIGYGGIVEPNGSRTNPDPQPSTLDSSYTFPDAKTPLPACNGVGVTGLLRAEWMMVLGPRSTTGFAVQIDGQWTGCVDDTGRVEPDTATPIVRRQWWPQVGGSLGWEILWR